MYTPNQTGNSMILAADIGGTKTHLALFKEGKETSIVAEKKYSSKKYASLSLIIKEFLSENPCDIQKACLGIAGPIQNGVCKTTNLAWTVDAKELSEILGIQHVWLLNDLEAMAYGIFCLRPDEFFVLNEGSSHANANAALLAAGTGLGQVGLFWDGKKHRTFASEAAHADFAPRTEDEIELLRYLTEKFKRVSYERVLSGPGLHNIYRFLIDTKREKECLIQEFKDKDPPRVIVEMALKKSDKACMRALEMFVSLYGSQTGNTALTFLSLGGIYIGGGIAPHIIEVMNSGIFMQSYLAKGRLSPLLASIPVKVILNEKTPLLGAASYAQQEHIK